MNSTKEAARTAGVLYFLSSLPAPFSLLYIPSVFMVMGDATATANKIRTSPLLFRVGHCGRTNQRDHFYLHGVWLHRSGFLPFAERGQQETRFADVDIGFDLRPY